MQDKLIEAAQNIMDHAERMAALFPIHTRPRIVALKEALSAARAHDAPETLPWWEKEWAESFNKYHGYAHKYGCIPGGDVLEFVLQDALAYRASHAAESAAPSLTCACCGNETPTLRSVGIMPDMCEPCAKHAESAQLDAEDPAEPVEDVVSRMCELMGGCACEHCIKRMTAALAVAREGYVKLEDVEKAIARKEADKVKTGGAK